MRRGGTASMGAVEGVGWRGAMRIGDGVSTVSGVDIVTGFGVMGFGVMGGAALGCARVGWSVWIRRVVMMASGAAFEGCRVGGGAGGTGNWIAGGGIMGKAVASEMRAA